MNAWDGQMFSSGYAYSVRICRFARPYRVKAGARSVLMPGGSDSLLSNMSTLHMVVRPILQDLSTYSSKSILLRVGASSIITLIGVR